MPYFLRKEEGEKSFSRRDHALPARRVLSPSSFSKKSPGRRRRMGLPCLWRRIRVARAECRSAGRGFPGIRGRRFSGFLGYRRLRLSRSVFSLWILSPRPRIPSSSELICLFAGALAGAAVESLPSELDDNVLPPLVGAAVLSCLLGTRAGWADVLGPGALRGVLVALAVNVVVSGDRPRSPPRPSLGRARGRASRDGHPRVRHRASLLPRSGSSSGSARSRRASGRARKEAIGKAEEKGGRRGAANVLANVSVAAFCALVAGLGPDGDVFRLAAAAALATALMDTVGTEIGQVDRVADGPPARFPPRAAGHGRRRLRRGHARGTRGGRAPRGRGRRRASPHGRAAPSPSSSRPASGTVLESLLGRDGRSLARLERPRPELPEHARGRRRRARAFSGPREPSREPAPRDAPLAPVHASAASPRHPVGRRLRLRKRPQPGPRAARDAGAPRDRRPRRALRVAPQRGLERPQPDHRPRGGPGQQARPAARHGRGVPRGGVAAHVDSLRARPRPDVVDRRAGALPGFLARAAAPLLDHQCFLLFLGGLARDADLLGAGLRADEAPRRSGRT